MTPIDGEFSAVLWMLAKRPERIEPLYGWWQRRGRQYFGELDSDHFTYQSAYRKLERR